MDGIIKSTGARRRRRLRLGPAQRAGVAVLLVVMLIWTASWAVTELRLRTIDQPVDGLKEGSRAGINVLVVATRGEAPRLKVVSLALVHLFEDGGRPMVVSIPPDLRIHTRSGKAKRMGDTLADGSEELITEVSRYSKLDLHHFVSFDVNGVGETAGSLGGVELALPGPPDQSCRKLEGDQIDRLIVSSKHPMSSIKNLTVILQAAGKKIDSPAFYLLPWRMMSVGSVLARNVHSDDRASVGALRDLARQIADHDPDVRSIPISEPSARIDGVDYVIANEAQTRALFDALAKDEVEPSLGKTGAPLVDRSEVALAVLNGTGAEGLAKSLADQLVQAGFKPPETGNAPPHKTTIVYHRPGAEHRGKVVAAMLEAQVKPIPTWMSAASDATIALGDDFARGEVRFDPSALPDIDERAEGSRLLRC